MRIPEDTKGVSIIAAEDQAELTQLVGRVAPNAGSLWQ